MPQFITIEGGLPSESNEKVRFDATFHDEVVINEIMLALGEEGEDLGLSVDGLVSADVTAAVDITFSFGILLAIDLYEAVENIPARRWAWATPGLMAADHLSDNIMGRRRWVPR